MFKAREVQNEAWTLLIGGGGHLEPPGRYIHVHNTRSRYIDYEEGRARDKKKRRNGEGMEREKERRIHTVTRARNEGNEKGTKKWGECLITREEINDGRLHGDEQEQGSSCHQQRVPATTPLTLP